MEKIKRLTADEYMPTLQLYYECMKDDAYMHSLFNGDVDKNTFYHTFGDAAMSIISEGTAYGYFEEDKLVGLVLMLDYHKWQYARGYTLRDVVFGGKGDCEAWCNTVKDFLDNQKNETMYIMEVAVKYSHRRQGIANKLLTHVSNLYSSNYSLVADLSNPVSAPMFVKQGYKIYSINNIPIARKLGVGRWM